MAEKSSSSLTILIIVMALLAIFVGFLIGHWMVQMMAEDTEEGISTAQPAEPQPPASETTSPADDPAPEKQDEQYVEVSEESLAEETEENDQAREVVPETEKEIESSGVQQIETDFAVQVGVFSYRENAKNLMEQLEEDGFNPLLVAEDPYRIQLEAASPLEEAEKFLNRVQEAGYEAFLIID